MNDITEAFRCVAKSIWTILWGIYIYIYVCRRTIGGYRWAPSAIPLLCDMFAWIQSQLFKHYSSGSMVVKAGCKNSCRYLNFRLFSWGMRHSGNHKITAKKQHLPINAPDEPKSDTWQRNLISLESSRKNPWMVSCSYLSSQSVSPSNWSLWGSL